MAFYIYVDFDCKDKGFASRATASMCGVAGDVSNAMVWLMA